MVSVKEIDLNKKNAVTHFNVTQVWPGGTTTVPLDEPKCGFQGEKCIEVPSE